MRLLTILLWAAFAVLLAAGGVVLLDACDVDHPHFLGTTQRFCPRPADTSVRDRAMARRDAIQNRIHDAELKIAQIANCAPVPSPSASPARPTPQPSASPQPTPSPRAQNTGPTVGRRGKLEVTLWWNTKDDLDLTINCPGGILSPRSGQHGPNVCGDGVHDVDANQKMLNSVSDPKEHAAWTSPPDGDYRVEVKAYQTSHPNPIDYSVRIEFDGEVKICSGKVQWNGSTGTYQSPITFRPQHPLPECDYQNMPETLCSGAGCK